MPHVPAICDNCGAAFNSGFVANNARSITFAGFRAGPCPACGSMGHVPDGVYNLIGSTIELLRGPTRSVAELQRLAAAIEAARTRGTTPDEVRTILSRELSEFSSLWSLLPQTRAEFYNFLTLILATISLIVSLRSSNTDLPEQEQTINIIIENTINVQPNRPRQEPPTEPPPRVDDV